MKAGMRLEEPGPADASSGRIAVVSANASTRLRLQSLLVEEGYVVAAAAIADIEAHGLAGIDALVVDLGEHDVPPVALVGRLPCVVLGDWPAPPPLTATPAAYLHSDAAAEEIVAAVAAVRAGLVVYAPDLAPAGTGDAPRPEARGGEQLTPREMEVLRLMADGLPNKGIARALGISDHTAKFHVGAILGKLDAQSRAEAVMQAARRGLIPL